MRKEYSQYALTSPPPNGGASLPWSAATTQCSIGFAELAISISHEHSANTIPVLIDPKDVLHIDFDSSLA